MPDDQNENVQTHAQHDEHTLARSDIASIEVTNAEHATVARPDILGSDILQKLLGLGIAWVEGGSDKFKVDTKGSPLKFTAKNPFGVEEHFVINGALEVDMHP
jgi:hypothetical protein